MSTQPFVRIEIEPGRRLHCCIEGPEDAPVILYDAGAYGMYADGWWVQEALKDSFRIGLYDRAGLGDSDPVPGDETPSPDWHAADMVRLLDAIKADAPVILIGHSMAGLRLHAFANLYPDHLRGLVFIDAVSPRVGRQTLNHIVHKQFNWIAKATAQGAKLGVADFAAKLAPNNFKLSGKPREDKVRAFASLTHHDAARDEVLAVDHHAPYLDEQAITQFPLAIFAATMINSMREADADAARHATGYGWFGSFPREDHVSILIGVYAEAIAARVREIHAHTIEAVSKSSAA